MARLPLDTFNNPYMAPINTPIDRTQITLGTANSARKKKPTEPIDPVEIQNQQALIGVQSPFEQAQTEQLQEQTRQLRNPPEPRGQELLNLSDFGGQSATVTRPTYEQYLLGQSQGNQSSAQALKALAAQGSQARELQTLQAAQHQESLRLQAQLASDAEARRFGRVPEIMGMLPGLNEASYTAGGQDWG